MLIILLPSLSLLLLPLIRTTFTWHLTTLRLITISILLITIKFPYTPFTSISSELSIFDYLNTPILILTFWISALIILASYTTLLQKKGPFIFIYLILLLNFILVITFLITNILIFYIFFEASLIPTLFLILGWGYQPERLQAGFYLIIYTVAASLPLLISLSLMFISNKSLSFINFHWIPPVTNKILSIWWFTTILAFLVKIPLYTFHLWLPKAHVEAPIAGSIILAGILLKLGRYGLIRLSTLFIFINNTLLAPLAALSIWGAFITRIICLRQPDIKSLIAYSSVGHIGLLTAATITNSTWGWEGSLLIITAHGLCSSAIFAIANSTYETTQTRRIFITKGLITLAPSITLFWFLLSAANIAAPPTLNLTSEILLITAILSSSLIMSFILALSRFLAAAYSLFLYTTTQHGSPPNFLNPINTLNTRNLIVLILHTIPLFSLILKIDLLLNWSLFWSYSWTNNIKLQI